MVERVHTGYICMTTQDIEQIQTIDSMYGTGKLNVYIKGEQYRVEVTELLKMLKYLPLETVMKRKYKYLTIKGAIV